MGEGPSADITQAGGLSAYGTMAQGGNVFDWVETEFDFVNDTPDDWRNLLGGSWFYASSPWFAHPMSNQIHYMKHPDGKQGDQGFRVASVAIRGDFNLDGLLDVNDVDLLTQQVVNGLHPTDFDLNNDAHVTVEDHRIWVKDLEYTWYGDANFDGTFNTSDLVQVLGAGKYETQEYAGWSEGDWNGDGVFGTGDLVKALEDGGYEEGLRTDALAVPEPAGWLLLGDSLLATIRDQRRRRCMRH